ncbi:MAG: hypothetical protein D6705_08305 [Deltaproteobacteria bacterium]|nr:MAG: hypothetical protein D6705_08305 [Deltaproteobacteria bacterium]
MSAPSASPDLARLLEHAGIEDGGAAVLAWARERARELIDAAPDDLLARIREGEGSSSPSLPPIPRSDAPAGTEAAGAGEDVEEIEELEDVEILDDDDLELIEEDEEAMAEASVADPEAPTATSRIGDDEAEHMEERAAADASNDAANATPAGSEHDDEDGDLFDEDELDLDLSGL